MSLSLHEEEGRAQLILHTKERHQPMHTAFDFTTNERILERVHPLISLRKTASHTLLLACIVIVASV